MSHSKLTRALLSVLVLSSAPLMAAAISETSTCASTAVHCRRTAPTWCTRATRVARGPGAAGDVVWIIAAPADKGHRRLVGRDHPPSER